MSLTLSLLPYDYAICRLDASEKIPAWAIEGYFFTVTRTQDELSIVCEQSQVPLDTRAELGWRCLKLHGPIPFKMTGIISSLTKPLAMAGISVSTIATYDTDYLLVKSEALDTATAALREAGFEVQL